MNCPFHILIFESHTRSYRDLPMRYFEFGTVYRYEKSGCRPRPHPGAGHDPGRRAHLHDQGDDGRGDRVAPQLRAGRAARLRARRLLPRAVDQAGGEGGRHGRGVGRGDRGAARRGVEDRPRARDGPGWRRVLRPEDLGAGPRRDRPHVAALDDPAGLPAPAALRPALHRRRQRAAPADHDPPRAVRVDRAVLRDPARALRRRVPALARAGAGQRAAGRRSSSRVRVPAGGPVEGRRVPGRDPRRAQRHAGQPRAAGEDRQDPVRARRRRRGRGRRHGRRERTRIRAARARA